MTRVNEDKACREFADAASPLNWYEVAKLMHKSAHILHNSPKDYIMYSQGSKHKTRTSTNRSEFLLAAFAIENLIKAYLIYENPSFIEGGKLSKTLLNNHSLSKLQRLSKRVPSPKRTRHVFETLEIGVNSWARYPCSTLLERETEELTVTDGFWEVYNKVFKLYSDRLESLLSKRWKGAYGEIGYVEFVSDT